MAVREKAQKKGDTCNRRYRLAIMKTIVLYFPTLALSKSGHGSEPISSLSAGFSQLPVSRVLL